MVKKTTAKKANNRKKTTHHAEAGRLGGLAPHICRGSECTKLKSAAAKLKKARGYSAEDLLNFFEVATPKHTTKKTVAKETATTKRGRTVK